MGATSLLKVRAAAPCREQAAINAELRTASGRMILGALAASHSIYPDKRNKPIQRISRKDFRDKEAYAKEAEAAVVCLVFSSL
jgi:hypothetical protein